MDQNIGNALKGMTPQDLPDVVCDECKNPTFRQVVLLKRVSAAISPSGNNSFLPMPVFECSSCGHVNDDLLPKQPSSTLA
tara:strand:+ start:833 stop:1072 length:240 start_codon:yes stop_codon:yes gene_type:complete